MVKSINLTCREAELMELLAHSMDEKGKLMRENDKNCRLLGMSGERESALKSENERLRKAAANVWHTSCDKNGTTKSAREHAEAMQNLWRELGMPDHPYRHPDHIADAGSTVSNKAS